jgi:hypothetical protein
MLQQPNGVSNQQYATVSIYWFFKSALHVSGDVFAHPHVYTGIYMFGTMHRPAADRYMVEMELQISPETCRADLIKIIERKLLHLVGYLQRCINNARSHKHQVQQYIYGFLLIFCHCHLFYRIIPQHTSLESTRPQAFRTPKKNNISPVLNFFPFLPNAQNNWLSLLLICLHFIIPNVTHFRH